MKKFILIITLVGFTYLSLSLYVYFRFFFNKIDSDVEATIGLATTKYPFVIKKIRIGDSVGKQLYPTGAIPDSGVINLTSNYGVSLLAHYLLLRKITTVNRDNLSDSLVIEGHFRPLSVAYNLDGAGATNYFLKKFYNNDWFFNEELLDQAAAERLDQAFLSAYPKRKTIRLLYPIKASRLFTDISAILNPGVPVQPNKNSLCEALAPLMQQYFPQYKTYYNAVSQSKSAEEIQIAGQIKNLWKGVNTVRVFPDSIFMKDRIHFEKYFVY